MDYVTASRDELIASHREQAARIAALETLIHEQQVTIARLEQRIAELERGDGPPRRMPGHQREQAEERPRRPRRKRAENAARRRSEPTAQVVHAVERCPQCDLPLAGGSIKRTREVLEVVPLPATITAHVSLERCCPGCGKRWTPRVDLTGVVVGQSRLGVGLISLIATLREEARLPFRTIQTLLQHLYGLDLSVGALVSAVQQVARVGQAAMEQFLAAIRASPVVQADETGWRQNGRNGYVWTFSTPTTRYYCYGSRGKGMVDQVLGVDTAAEAEGVLVSDCYAAYDHYPGVQQTCWVHLLRDLHELCRRHSADGELVTWATAVHALYTRAVALVEPEERVRQQHYRHWTDALGALCQPYLADETAVQAVLCRRIEKYLPSWFVFVLEPAVPADNNAAERSLRHLVISRKVSGGTRSEEGTDTKMTLASLFGTWRVRGENPYLACRLLLCSPQP